MDHSEVNETGQLGAAAGYFDTPKGIWTREGFLFHTTASLLQAYAGDVLAHTSLDRLLKGAIDWLRSPENLAACLLPILLLYQPYGQALGITAIVYLVWKIASPGLVSINLLGVFSVLAKTPVQAGIYLIALSLLGMRGNFIGLGIGIGFFLFVRWGGLAAVSGWLFKPVYRWLYKTAINDKVLKSLILRTALRHRLSVPELDAMEQKLVDLARKK